MEALLVKSELWDYVCGKKQKPLADEVAISKWESEDAKAKANVILSISASELRHVRGCTTSNQVWIKLHAVFASRGPAKKATLLKRLLLHKMGDSGDIREEIGIFFDVVDRLESMEVTIHEELVSVMLLYSLPASFENFRCAIESRDELPKPEILKVKILEEYESKNVSSGTQVMYTHQNENLPYNDQRRWTNGNQSRKSWQPMYKPMRCYRCNRPGHRASDCRQNNVNIYHHHNDNNADEGLICLNVTGLEETNFIASLKQQWVLDSGCTSHLCGDLKKFEGNLENVDGKLNLATNLSTVVRGKGVVRLSALGEKSVQEIEFDNTLYVPDLRTNLISVAKITDKGHSVNFTRDRATIIDESGKIILTAFRRGNLYSIQQCESANAISDDRVDLIRCWHERLGHLNGRDVAKLLNKIGERVSENDVRFLRDCETCAKGKMHASPFSNSAGPCSEKLRIVYSDIVGPMRCQSKTGAKYFITFIDDSTRWCEVYFLSTKAKALEAFKIYKSHVENLTGSRIKYFQTDNGGEYCSGEFDDFLHKEGISRRLTVAHTPQQNGVAERMNRTLVEMARCMLLNCELPTVFWAEAVDTACYIRNRCPTSSLGGEIPYEKWFDKPVKIGYLKKFGTEVHVLDKSPNNDKFAARGIPGIFVGYPRTSKGFRVWIPEERRFIIARDIKFCERIGISVNAPKTMLEIKNKDENEKKFIEIELINKTTEENGEVIPTEGELRVSEPTQPSEEVDTEDRIGHAETDNVDMTPQVILKRGVGRPKIERTGRVGRPKKIYRVVEVEEETRQVETTAVPEASEPETSEQQELETENAESSDDVYTDCVDFAGVAGISLDDALQSDEKTEWEEAILSEIRSLVNKGTWEIVKRPKNRNVVGCRYVLTTKLNVDKTTKKKARLVAQGFSQRFGVDYDKTFAPVARLDSVRLLMALSVELDLEIHQLDINTAYLNGDLEEEIYMRTPRLLKDCLMKLAYNQEEDPSVVERARAMLKSIDSGGDTCLLRKSLYGLKQAGRQWNIKLDKKLKDMGLSQSLNEPCLYTRIQGGEHLLVLVFVDDILIASEKEDRITRFKSELKKEFDLKDYGRAKYFLGMDIKRNDSVIKLSQEKYVKDILENFGMGNCNTCKTPMETSGLDTNKAGDEQKKWPYRELIGSLMYLSVATRPDITNSVIKLAQYTTDPKLRHWNAAKRVLRYLKGTSNYGLVFKKTGKSIEGYCDADWGGCSIDRRSFSGYAFSLGGACVSWSSRKQRSVATSSCEAEYISLSEAVKEGLYLQSLLTEIGFERYAPIHIYADSQSAIFLAQDPVFHGRSKHIDIKYHFIRGVLRDNKDITLSHVPTEGMLADVLTKALPSAKHFKCAYGLGVKPC